jgi:glycosyl hydrolase family 16
VLAGTLRLKPSLLAMCLGSLTGAVGAAVPGPPPFGPTYRLKFVQDFTALTSLAVDPDTMTPGSLWIAHKPGGGDWFTFIDPVGDFHPFGIGDGKLTIRCARRGYGDPNDWFGGYSGGFLSSMDGRGAGFAQEYGYFECSMWCPGGPNTWPAFWLLDAPSLTTATDYAAEIDVTESYGNFGTGPNQIPPGNPNQDGVTWHNWGRGANPTTAKGIFVAEPGRMTTGYHRYGVDIEPDVTAWYFDRVKVWQQPTLAAARAPMFVMVNLALGGGSHNNAAGTGYDWSRTPDPSDLKVEYIAVWASPPSPSYDQVPPAPAGLVAEGTAASGQIALRWKPSSGATSYDLYRGTSTGGEDAAPIATGLANPSHQDAGLTDGATYFYQVVGVNSVGASPRSIEASAVPFALDPLLRGSGIDDGHGPWNGNLLHSADRAFDGNTGTFYDCALGSGGFTGIDLGAGVTGTVTAVRWWARRGMAGRMMGGYFEGSRSRTSGFIRLATVQKASDASWTTATIPPSGPHRFLRYVGPAGGYSNVAEIEFRGTAVGLPAGRQLPGDLNQDGRFDLSDAVWLLFFLFGQAPALPCEASGDGPGNVLLLDANGDGRADIADAIAVLRFLFLNGPAHDLGRSCLPVTACPDDAEGCPQVNSF